MKLQAKKQQFSEIMNRKTKLKTWRQKIIEEELKLKADIRKVLEHGIMKMEETSGRGLYNKQLLDKLESTMQNYYTTGVNMQI